MTMATVTKRWTPFNSLLSFTTSRLLPFGRKTGDESSCKLADSQEGKVLPHVPDVADESPELIAIKRAREITGVLEKIEREVTKLAYDCKCKVVKKELQRQGVKTVQLPKQESKIVGGGVVSTTKLATARKILNIMTDSVMIKSNYKCSYCGLDFLADLNNFFLYTRDHVVPKSKGGTAGIDNMAACCLFCNKLKDDETTVTMKHARAIISQKRIAWQGILDSVRGIARD